jgi:anti-sigma regulatory factor (Ser/Thr protein kinase)
VRELSLHILDIVENGIRAGGNLLTIDVQESTADDRLTLAVEDNGRGMPAEKAQRIDDPFITTRTTRRVGLGLSLLASAARRCAGDICVQTAPQKGTRVTATFVRSHIDRAPLGDMASTLGVLIAGYPHIDFRYTHRVDEREFVLDTRDLKTELTGLSLSDPMVVHHLTESIRRSLAELAVGSTFAAPMENADV